MKFIYNWAAIVLATASIPSAAAAPWEVEAEMRFREDGVIYAIDAGLPLLEKLIQIPLGESERVGEEEIEAVRKAVEAQLESLIRFTINGTPNPPQLVGFGIAGEKDAGGSYPRKGAIARLQVKHVSPPPLESVSFEWELLPERYFEDDVVNDLLNLLEPRDRSALVRLGIGAEPVVELEMRMGQEDFAWERGSEEFSPDEPVTKEVRTSESAWWGRMTLIVVLVVLIVLRLAFSEFRNRKRRA